MKKYKDLLLGILFFLIAMIFNSMSDAINFLGLGIGAGEKYNYLWHTAKWLIVFPSLILCGAFSRKYIFQFSKDVWHKTFELWAWLLGMILALFAWFPLYKMWRKIFRDHKND